jgi:murein DD-endopeptidase MepM/ murein hydrolase activator NlpD
MLVVALGLLAGCSGASDNPAVVPAARSSLAGSVVSTITPFPPTATPSPLPSSTPTVTPRPTLTPTATATARPLTLSGEPWLAAQAEPVAQEGALCGLVDTLDFPLNPPDAAGVARGGQDFARFRSRYDLFHAGEDWWLASGRSNFGRPVFSIGHGTITYAQPNGWGRDQGVVIVRHVFSDGRSILSFYGHLDPPSVNFRVGDCVTRGQKIGEIGQPRTPPHLHFEIRSHMPNEPGPGYWAVDPTEAGWIWPSQFIWQERIRSLPGTTWVQAPSLPEAAENGPWPVGGTGYWTPIGGASQAAELPELQDVLIVVRDGQLQGLEMADGRLRWWLGRTPDLEVIQRAQLDATGRQMYVAGRLGEVAAYDVAAFIRPAGSRTSIASDTGPSWSLDLELIGSPTLMPLPGGGLIVATRQKMIGLSLDGDILWEAPTGTAPENWLVAGDQLLVAMSGRGGMLWSVMATGPAAWADMPSGRLALAGDKALLYRSDGLYLLDPVAQTAEQWFPLSQSFLGLGQVLAQPDGGLMLVHRDQADTRLLLLDGNGGLRWERSLRGLARSEYGLLAVDGRPYLISQRDAEGTSELLIMAVDLERAELTTVFRGGSRSPATADTWLKVTADGGLVISIGGGSLALFQP